MISVHTRALWSDATRHATQLDAWQVSMTDDFSAYARSLWSDATDLVDLIAPLGRAIDMTRAVLEVLRTRHGTRLDAWRVDLVLVDGHLRGVDHSWLLYRPRSEMPHPHRSSGILSVRV